MRIEVTQVSFTPAGADDRMAGLLGWVSAVVNSALKIDGLTLRRTRDGRPALSYPTRCDGQGRQHPYIRPLTDRIRRDMEEQVFSLLGLEHLS